MALLSDFQYIACVVQLPEAVVTMGHSAATLIGKNLEKITSNFECIGDLGIKIYAD